jgi:glucan phosphoethanolaminetransferase (alkaline phosphatase superfamily)
MPPALKNTFESAVLSLVAAGGALWMVINDASAPDPSPTRIVVASLALAVALTMHLVFALQLVKRSGKPFVPWCIAIVLFAPIGSAMLLAVLMGNDDGEAK